MAATIALGADGDLLSVLEAARLLGVSPSTIWRWIEQSRVPAYRLGPKRVRLKRSELECLVTPLTGRDADRDVERPILPLTDHERACGLALVARLRQSHAEQLAARGGIPFRNGWELSNESRDERFEQLG